MESTGRQAAELDCRGIEQLASPLHPASPPTLPWLAELSDCHSSVCTGQQRLSASSHLRWPCSVVPSCPLQRRRHMDALGRVLSQPQAPNPLKTSLGILRALPGSQGTAVPVLSLPRRTPAPSLLETSSTPSKIGAPSQHL